MMGYLSFGRGVSDVLLRPFTVRAKKTWVTETDRLQNSETTPQAIFCASCGGPLGSEKEESGCVRLYKWNLRLRRANNTAWQTLQMQTIVCAQLLELIETQATYKVLVYSGVVEDAKKALLVSSI